MQDVPEPEVGETGRGTPERFGVSERVDLYTGALGKALGGASCVNTSLFRSKMTDGGFEILPGEHPIVPVMYGEARDAADVAERLLAEGIYVIPSSSRWCSANSQPPGVELVTCAESRPVHGLVHQRDH